ncbi:uncharacterized protein RHOBADRAFT_45262 [Rhodotorula graminis WP1]|uniref:Uncharacterized protein n=1 Tax=Rhodotorula graminis (strain WP1) TaxID=578459 RepID=A0A0P9IW22_RHOGW|nr:uncharacterized protein RHOBADRAFT_45262 [Rhodotorula graminis WP1]KPV73969.1 hypothetical protein RHOBADRAFT_45262 [Rhodotorula graminis WP1]
MPVAARASSSSLSAPTMAPRARPLTPRTTCTCTAHVSAHKHAFGVDGTREWLGRRAACRTRGFDAHCVVFGEREREGVGLGVAA